MNVKGKALRKQRLQLVGLAALFVAPVLISWLVWRSMQGEGALATTNAGELVHPAVPLVEFSVPGLEAGSVISLEDLNRKWTFVIIAKAGCQESCRTDLYNTRQLRTSVNKDIDRVQRLLILQSQPDAELAAFLETEHPFLIVAVEGQDGSLSSQFAVKNYRSDGAYIFLLDPLANLMMAYSREVSWKGMFKDLRKLLKTSQIG